MEAMNPLAQSGVTQVERRPLRLFVLHLLDVIRVGLVTNHTGRTRSGTPSATALRRAGVGVVALFAPELGLGGQKVGGEGFGDDTEQGTALPVYSLYGDRRSPDPAILQEMDALVFDVQDIGARYYTYVSTMVASMEAAAGAGIRFVVADRSNPIGGLLVQGNVLDPELASFVGPFPVPMRHGIEADLHVVPASGWSRESWADETGLAWVATSPNMPTLESAVHYPGTCLFERTNVSVGRGTDRPFQQLGAPWLDSGRWWRRSPGTGCRVSGSSPFASRRSRRTTGSTVEQRCGACGYTRLAAASTIPP